MDTRKIDLHVHSTASDGTMSPAELAVAVKEAGLCAFALTDHDTVDGIAEARTAAKAASVELIPGVELSCDYKGKEVHMVGLYLDETNPRLLTHLARFRDNRDNRNQKMYQKLNEEGFAISEEGLREMFPDAVLTRAHVARFLLEHGYIKSISEAFEKYIGDGCRCHVPREKITPQEGIELIHHANCAGASGALPYERRQAAGTDYQLPGLRTGRNRSALFHLPAGRRTLYPKAGG